MDWAVKTAADRLFTVADVLSLDVVTAIAVVASIELGLYTLKVRLYQHASVVQLGAFTNVWPLTEPAVVFFRPFDDMYNVFCAMVV